MPWLPELDLVGTTSGDDHQQHCYKIFAAGSHLPALPEIQGFADTSPSPVGVRFQPRSLTASLGFELFELQVRALHEVLPFLDIGVEEFYEVRLVVLEERDADFRQIRARLGLLEHALDVARDVCAELGRNGNGGEEALPQRRLVLRQPL